MIKNAPVGISLRICTSVDFRRCVHEGSGESGEAAGEGVARQGQRDSSARGCP